MLDAKVQDVTSEKSLQSSKVVKDDDNNEETSAVEFAAKGR